MSRMVKKAGTSTASFGPEVAGASTRQSSYAENLIKYIPGEFVALYTTIASSIPLIAVLSLPQKDSLHWLCIIILWVLIPIWFWWTKEPNDAWITQSIIGVIAFPLWVYALVPITLDADTIKEAIAAVGADSVVLTPRYLVKLYDRAIAALLIAFFTFGIGFYNAKK